MNISGNNIVGWIYRALISGFFNPDFKIPSAKSKRGAFYEKVITNMLNAVLAGRLKEIKLNKENRGFKNINPADYQ